MQFDALAGDGVMAITIEPRRDGKTYQGIVELSPAGIATSAETYFAQSEQLPTVVRLAAAPVYTPGSAVRRPGASAASCCRRRPKGADSEDDWERLASFLSTVEDIELVDLDLPAEDLCGGCSMRTRRGYCRPSRSSSAAIATPAAFPRC